MNLKKLTALLLALTLVFALAGCRKAAEEPTDAPSEEPVETVEPTEEATAAPTAEPTEAPTEAPTAEPTEGPTESPDAPLQPTGETVRLAVLSGPTGIGAAKLLADADNGSAANTYQYTIESDNSALVAGLTGPEPSYDIATMASNMAVNLYNKTDGGVKIIALGTLGVLHILEGGGTSEVNSIADLAGKTIWSAGQGANPEYILRYLLTEYGIADQVTVEFADASEIQAKLLSGDIQYAMLPVPAATAAMAKGEGQVRDAVDVTEAWNGLDTGSQLVMTAVVARTAFIQEHPAAVDAFLSEYGSSIDFVTSNEDAAANLIAGYGITPSAGIAKAAIPQCHLTYIVGSDMAPAISGYFRALWTLDPASVGGYVPDDGIYYVG